MGIFDFFRKQHVDPVTSLLTREQRQRMARIVNPQQRAALLAAIRAGLQIHDDLWRPLPADYDLERMYNDVSRAIGEASRRVGVSPGDFEEAMMAEFAKEQQSSCAKRYSHEPDIQAGWEKIKRSAEYEAKKSPGWHEVLSAVGYKVSSRDVGLCPPLRNCGFLRDRVLIPEYYVCHLPLVSWGIFNPNGPTWNTLTLATAKDEAVGLIFFEHSNPFNQHSVVLGWRRQGAGLDQTISVIQTLFDKNGNGLFFCSPPTFVVTELSAPVMRSPEEAANWIRAGMISQGDCDISENLRDMRRFWMKPWDRVTHIRAQCRGVSPNNVLATANCQLFRQGKKRPGASEPLAEFDNWFEAVCHPDHVDSEIDALRGGWLGATTQLAPACSSIDVLNGTWFHATMMKIGATDLQS